MRHLQLIFRRQVRFCRRSEDDGLENMSLKMDKLDISVVLQPEETSVQKIDIWKTLNVYLRERSVKLKDISKSSDSIKERILEQVFNNDPLLVGIAMTEWKIREQEDRLQASPINLDKKIRGIQLITKFNEGIYSGNESLIKNSWKAIVDDRLHHRLWSTEFTNLCKSSSHHVAEWAVEYYRQSDRRPDIQMYTSYLMSKRSYSEVKKILSLMNREGIVIDAKVYFASMKACRDDIDSLKYFLSRMDISKRIKANHRHYNLLLQAYSEAMQYDEVEKLWQRMSMPPSLVSSYGFYLMISSRCKNNNIRGAYSMLRLAEDAKMASSGCFHILMSSITDIEKRKKLLQRLLKCTSGNAVPKVIQELIPLTKTFQVGNEVNASFKKNTEAPLKEWNTKGKIYQRGPFLGDSDKTPSSLWEVLEVAEQQIRKEGTQMAMRHQAGFDAPGQGKMFHDQSETFKPESATVIHAERDYVDYGTTIMACVTKEGVLLASDGKTSRGRLVACLDAPKPTKLTDKIYALRCGNAAHTQMLCRIIPKYIRLLEVQLGEDPPVETAARLFQLICRNNNLSFAVIVAGWDKFKGGQIFSVSSDGCKIESNFAMNGSGSTFLWGWMDSTYREGMTEPEAREWLNKGIALAKARDVSSGGCTRIVSVREDGVKTEMLPWSETPFKLENDPRFATLRQEGEPFPAGISN